MARQSSLCWPNARQARVDDLAAAGFPLQQAGIEERCPVCACRMGDHVVALPGNISLDTLLDRTGWVECATCDVSCGTWTLALREE